MMYMLNMMMGKNVFIGLKMVISERLTHEVYRLQLRMISHSS